MKIILDFITDYFWHLMALTIAPLLGFTVGQMYKVSKNPRPGQMRIIFVAGIMTGVISFWFWPGTLDESAKIGLTTGIGGPFIVWLWFQAASRWAPDKGESLKGTNGDLTILPWVKVKKKKMDPTLMMKKLHKKVDFDVTGGHDIKKED